MSTDERAIPTVIANGLRTLSSREQRPLPRCIFQCSGQMNIEVHALNGRRLACMHRPTFEGLACFEHRKLALFLTVHFYGSANNDRNCLEEN